MKVLLPTPPGIAAAGGASNPPPAPAPIPPLILPKRLFKIPLCNA